MRGQRPGEAGLLAGQPPRLSASLHRPGGDHGRIPLGYEVFAGNRNDATTVEEIVEAMEAKYGRANRVWVMDRGMVSEENLKFLRERGGQYIVGTPKAMLRQFEEYLTRKDWHEVQEGVEVQLVPGPEGDETFVLARSADRREKEKAMHQRFVERLEAALGRMQASAASGRLKDEAVANRRLGRLMCQYWRAAGAFDVKIERLSPPQGKARLRVAWTRNGRWSDWAALSEGCYLLADEPQRNRSGHAVEALHPVDRCGMGVSDHQGRTADSPDLASERGSRLAHILVCFLAYVLWKTLGQWMRRSGLGDAPRTVLEELAKIKSGDVVLPTGTKEGHYNGTVRLRCVTEPDEAQKVLLHRLGVTLPRRLRRINEFVQM